MAAKQSMARSRRVRPCAPARVRRHEESEEEQKTIRTATETTKAKGKGDGRIMTPGARGCASTEETRLHCMRRPWTRDARHVLPGIVVFV